MLDKKELLRSYIMINDESSLISQSDNNTSEANRILEKRR